MKRDIIFNREYNYPPEMVWHALTDSDALEEWMMPNDFEPVVGHKFQFHTDPKPGFDGVTHCEVLVVEPHRTLAYTFAGGGIDTVVRFRLEPTESGTRLTVEHTGFSGLRAWLVSLLMQMGVKTMYDKKLPSVLRQLTERQIQSPRE